MSRIHHLIEDAADQFDNIGAVDLCLQTELAGEGYFLSAIDNDIAATLAERNGGHF